MTTEIKTYHLGDEQVYAKWDNSLGPLLTVRSGEIVEMETREASDGQLALEADLAVLRNLDFSRIHPLTGPVAVEDAEPGDVVELEVLDLKPKGWGWTAIIPGFSLLAEDFTTPHLVTWNLTKGDTATFGSTGITIPLDPFMGVMGVAPKESGVLNTIPPRQNGGNVDIKQLTKGSRIKLPVLYPGALISLGDGHAAQGDGEVCGTAIECPMTVTFKVTLHKNQPLQELQYFTYGSRMDKTNRRGYYVTTAHGPDLMESTKNCIRYMIDYLGRTYQLSPEDAYVLCSVAVDLKISEVVDAPNWIVSAFLPQDIFPG